MQVNYFKLSFSNLTLIFGGYIIMKNLTKSMQSVGEMLNVLGNL